MPSHWTYTSFGKDDDLMQGDILAPTRELKELFESVHPHFADSKYIGFIITTQSCDLARREGSCSVHYINLAVIRSLHAVLPTLLGTVCSPVNTNAYSQKDKSKAVDLLKRLFNQNEQKLGLFYLEPDAGIGIADASVAFLRVNVAFRVEHYQVMTSARSGRLSGEFSNKLGWLLGNLYARVGTKDWTKDVLAKKISQLIDSKTTDAPRWVNERVVDAIKKTGCEPKNIPESEFIDMLKIKIQRPKDAGIEAIMQTIQEALPDLSLQETQKIKTRITNNPTLTAAFRT